MFFQQLYTAHAFGVPITFIVFFLSFSIYKLYILCVLIWSPFYISQCILEAYNKYYYYYYIVPQQERAITRNSRIKG